jgi:hypothetical protein
VVMLAAASPALARGHRVGGHGGFHGNAHVAGGGLRGGYRHDYARGYRGYGYRGYGYGGYGYGAYGPTPDIFAGLFGGSLAYACGDMPYSSCYYGY